MINHYGSAVHRLPPEILAAVASHLGDIYSLITATHVCHHLRMALLSSPRLWSHLKFGSEERVLAFLERSKLAPVSVDLVGLWKPSEGVRESLNGIIHRLTGLRGLDDALLDGLLDHPVPMLETLDIIGRGESETEKPMRSLPSLRSLTMANLYWPRRFDIPHLTNFHFERTYHPGMSSAAGLGEDLLNIFRGCPLLEVVSLRYGDTGDGEDLRFATDEASTKPVSLPHLRSFTHETALSKLLIGLFNRLSIPPTCVVGFAIDVTESDYRPWFPGFPAPRDQSYLSDVKRVDIAAYTVGEDYLSRLMLKTELVNSRNTKISFSRRAYPSYDPSLFEFDNFLDFLDDFGITQSVETLHFEDYPVPPHSSRGQTERDLARQLQKFCNLKSLVLRGCDPFIFLGDSSPSGLWYPTVEHVVVGSRLGMFCWDGEESKVVKRVRDVAVARQKGGSPLKSISMFFKTAETLLWECRGEIEELRSCVKSVEVRGLRF